MSILVTGTVALDTVKTPFGKIEEGLGGSATHFSVSAAHFTDVHLVAVVGEDFPQEHIDFLAGRKINIAGLEKAKGKTFRWEGKYEYDLNQAHTLRTDLNVLLDFKPKLTDAQKKIRHVFLANLDPDIQRSLIEQVEHPQVLACDTMNFWIEGKRDSLLKTLKRVDVLTINEGEARLLAQEANLLKAARIIQAMGPKKVVIKQGEYGAVLVYEDRIFSAPGLPLEEIKDPTGAGDSFAGGFMGYLARTGDYSFNSFRQAIILGSVMASYNVQDFSCRRLATLTKDDIRARADTFKELAHFENLTF